MIAVRAHSFVFFGALLTLLFGLVAPVSASPDLAVITIALDPKVPDINEGTLKVTLKNKGTGGTGIFSSLDYAIFLDGEQCDGDSIWTGLGGQEEKEIESDRCNASTPGAHFVTVFVDSTEEVDEPNESNNTLQVKLLWYDPDSCKVPEMCNGKDDDCDGEVDEIYVDLGQPCDGPDPDECASGVYVCGESGEFLTCQESGDLVELCNGLDDDCDGQTDEDYLGLGQPCTTVVNDCVIEGETTCAASGGGTTCAGQEIPGLEACNKQDDDCDGEIDEDFDHIGLSCVLGVGACRAVGDYQCAGGKTTCHMAPGLPVPNELCGNREDDDCDNVIDDGCACEPGSYEICGHGVGGCQFGIAWCDESGVLSSVCQGGVPPVPEICDNWVDDDCDGSIDEDCPCVQGLVQPCSLDSGLCALGQQKCINGVWGPCKAPGVSWPDVLDGVDNDCDSLVDESNPCEAGVEMACEAAPDECAEYKRLCQSDGTWTPCQAKPGTEVEGCAEPEPEPDTEPEPDVATPEPTDSVGQPTPVQPSPSPRGVLEPAGQPVPASTGEESPGAIHKKVVIQEGGCAVQAVPASGVGAWLWVLAALLWVQARREECQ